MNKMKRTSVFRRTALVAASLAMLASATACGRPNTNQGGRIAVICKNDKVSFWEEVKKGADDAGSELGYDIDYYCATGDNDYASQVEYINKAISDKVDAIVIAPNGVTELNDAFQKAEDAGIKIININSKADYDGVLSCVSSSDTDGGKVAARHAAAVVLQNDEISSIMDSGDASLTDVVKLGTGAVAIIGHTAATADNRITGFEEGCQTQIIAEMVNDGLDFSSLGENVTQDQIDAFFSTFFIEGERCSSIDAAYDEAYKLLSAKDCNVKCIYGTNTNTTLGICKAIEELGLGESVYAIGFNSDEGELAALRTGILDGTVIQNPYNMGYVGVRYATKAIGDESLPDTLDTGVTWVTAENMNDDYIQLLLHPDEN